jgi:hypothetical protein
MRKALGRNKAVILLKTIRVTVQRLLALGLEPGNVF